MFKGNIVILTGILAMGIINPLMASQVNKASYKNITNKMYEQRFQYQNLEVVQGVSTVQMLRILAAKNTDELNNIEYQNIKK